MTRLIDADALKKTLCEEYEAREHYSGEIMLKAIDNAPTVNTYTLKDMEKITEETLRLYRNVITRPQGKWKLHGMIYYCSNCGKDYEQGGNNFCGQCGADMRGANNG